MHARAVLGHRNLSRRLWREHTQTAGEKHVCTHNRREKILPPAMCTRCARVEAQPVGPRAVLAVCILLADATKRVPPTPSFGCAHRPLPPNCCATGNRPGTSALLAPHKCRRPTKPARAAPKPAVPAAGRTSSSSVHNHNKCLTGPMQATKLIECSNSLQHRHGLVRRLAWQRHNHVFASRHGDSIPVSNLPNRSACKSVETVNAPVRLRCSPSRSRF